MKKRRTNDREGVSGSNDKPKNNDGRLYDKNGRKRPVTASTQHNRMTVKIGANVPPKPNPMHVVSSTSSEYSDSEEDDVDMDELHAMEQAHLPRISGKGKSLVNAEMFSKLQASLNSYNNSTELEGGADDEMDEESDEAIDALYATPDQGVDNSRRTDISGDNEVNGSPKNLRRDIPSLAQEKCRDKETSELMDVPRVVKMKSHVKMKRGKGSKNEDAWKLTHGVDGGPKNPELLVGFPHHIAYKIWQGQDNRRVLVLVNRYAKIKKGLEILENRPDAVALIENTCLFHLIHCIYEHIDFALISAFVERWHPETKSFHMPFGEITILLHDVFWLLRIPIEGTALITSLNVDQTRDRVKNLLGLDEDTLLAGYSSGCFKFQTIETSLKASDAPVSRVAIGYMWWMLGITLFVDKVGHAVQADYLPFVQDIGQILSFSWGSATLANLYRQLGLATRFECKGIAGCLTLLQAWIYAYFPKFQPAENPRWSAEHPWVCKWIPKIDTKENREDVLLGYRRMLDNLTPINVQWMPFGYSCDDERFDISRFCGTITCRKVTEPYMPRRFMRQFGLAQTIPPHVDEPQKVRRSSGNNMYICEFYVPRSHFENWPDHVADFTECTRTSTGQADQAYLPWFIERTHPRVSPDDRNESDEEHVDGYGVRMQNMANMLYDYHPAVRTRIDMREAVALIDSICEELSDFFPLNLKRG